MLVLCFDGCDNLGKSTIIDNLKDMYKDEYNVFVIPSTAPPAVVTESSKEEYQETVFTQRARMIKAIYDANTKDRLDTIVLLDRFCYDEGVYGQIYRSATDEYVEKLCSKCYDIIKGSDTDIKFGVIRLTASPHFIRIHDDKKSFTSNMEDSDEREAMISREDLMFNKVLNTCLKNNSLDFYFTVNVEEKSDPSFDTIKETMKSEQKYDKYYKFRPVREIIKEIYKDISSVYYLENKFKTEAGI